MEEITIELEESEMERLDQVADEVTGESGHKVSYDAAVAYLIGEYRRNSGFSVSPR